jgi:hypothetical protein
MIGEVFQELTDLEFWKTFFGVVPFLLLAANARRVFWFLHRLSMRWRIYGHQPQA